MELNESCADDLERYYQFSTPCDTTTAIPPTPGVHYLNAGYPASRNHVGPLHLGLPATATFLVTGDIRNVSGFASSDKNDEHHFALFIPSKQVPKLRGGTFVVPRPNGMSGGGIWRFEMDTLRGWTTSPELVGIGIEYHKREKLFLAARVQAAIPLVQELLKMRARDGKPSDQGAATH